MAELNTNLGSIENPETKDSQENTRFSNNVEVKEKEKFFEIFVVSATWLPKWSPGFDETKLRQEIENLNDQRKKENLGEKHAEEIAQKENEISDIIRGNLTLESIKQATSLGINVYITDGGSSDEFLKELKDSSKGNYGKLKVFSQVNRGYGASRREAFQNAIQRENRNIGLMMEIEKTHLLTPEVLSALIDPISKDKADLVVVDRGLILSPKVLESDPKEWDKTYDNEFYAGVPPYQAHSEGSLNLYLHKTMVECGFIDKTTPVFDVLNGTRIFKNNETMSAVINNVFKSSEPETTDEDVYFSAVYSMFLELGALGKSHRIKQVRINYKHSPIQSLLETGSPDFNFKRDRQRTTIHNSIQGWTNNYLKKDNPLRVEIMDNKFLKKRFIDFFVEYAKHLLPADGLFLREKGWHQVNKIIYTQQGLTPKKEVAFVIDRPKTWNDEGEIKNVTIIPGNFENDKQALKTFEILDGYIRHNPSSALEISIPIGEHLPKVVIERYKERFKNGHFMVALKMKEALLGRF